MYYIGTSRITDAYISLHAASCFCSWLYETEVSRVVRIMQWLSW